MEEWKEWEGRGQEGGVWGGWVRGLSGSLSESQITRIKGFRGLGGRAYGKREIGDPSLQLLNRDREVDPTEVGCPTTMKQSRNGKLYRDWIPHPISHMALLWSAEMGHISYLQIYHRIYYRAPSGRLIPAYGFGAARLSQLLYVCTSSS